MATLDAEDGVSQYRLEKWGIYGGLILKLKTFIGQILQINQHGELIGTKNGDSAGPCDWWPH